MSIHPTRSGRWEVRWRQGGRNRSETVATEQEAIELDDEIKRRRRRGTLDDLDAGRDTLRDFAGEWFKRSASRRLERSTLEVYAGTWDRHILPWLGDYELRQITTGLIEDELVATWHARSVGVPTQRKALFILQAVLRYAVRRGHLKYNPAEQVERPRQKPTAVRPVAVDALERILAALEGRDRMLVELMGYAGLRPGEAIALTDQSIRKRTLLVEEGISFGEAKSTKTRRIRTVRLLDVVAQDLATYRLARPNAGLLFPRDGAAWSDSYYRNWRRSTFQVAAEAAGIATIDQELIPVEVNGKTRWRKGRRTYDGPRPYDLRHTFASLLIAGGKTIAQVADQLGNSVEVCASTYTHLFEEYSDAPAVDPDARIREARAEARSRAVS